MSIEVQNLVKFYGEHKALDSISFNAKSGMILGLLGPNGAGKSTTMKILSGFLPASSGQVRVAGWDIQKNSLQARSRIGYLPENNPLYPDMYIPEFLGFVAEIFRIKDKKTVVNKVMDQTGLVAVKGKKIGQLSKGFKQRVGLAQSLVGDPEVLILDEPTSGLDPNQLEDIRSLIKELGRDKTVILSTHIMQEVEILCQEVIIVNLGKIVAHDSVKRILQNYAGEWIYRIEFNEAMDESELRAIPHVIKVVFETKTNSGSYQYVIHTQSDELIRENLFDLAVKKNKMLLGLKKEDSDLTQVFQNLTRN